MKILSADNMGFCYGVRRAVDLALAGIEINGSDSAGARRVTLGPLIHNPQMIEKLAAKGVCAISSLEEAKGATVLIRSHGVGPEIYEAARQQGILIQDATCPHVLRAQQAARQFAERGFQVIVAGEKNHQEVKSILAWAGPGAIALENAADLNGIDLADAVGIVSQTTLEKAVLEEIQQAVQHKTQRVEVSPTICTATEERQRAAEQLSKQVDVMVVIGGKNSANTRHLADVCRKAGKPTYHIETARELEPGWFSGVDKAGVTAGASTPDWIIEEVIQRMENMEIKGTNHRELLEKGVILAGKVIDVQKDLVFVDIGQKSEGFVALNELAWPVPADAKEVVTVGQLLNVMVLDPETAEGSVKLSKVKADRVFAWDRLEESMKAEEALEVFVAEVVKGGLSVSAFGLPGFIPASQTDIAFVDDLKPFVGQTISVLPIEVDQDKQRAVFSRRLVLQKQKKQEEAMAMAKIEPGLILDGVVKRVASFGAFVDVGGIEGLVHVSEMAWHRVKDAADLLKVGDEVKVQVLKLDRDSRKLSLGMKQLQQDPWHTAVTKFAEGTSVTGKVTRTSKFGAFVELAAGIEGLVHISELSDRRVNSADEVVQVGQKVPVKILSVDPVAKRISLSLSKAQEDAERKEFEAFLGGSSSLGATIGDKLGHLFKNRE